MKITCKILLHLNSPANVLCYLRYNYDKHYKIQYNIQNVDAQLSQSSLLTDSNNVIEITKILFRKKFYVLIIQDFNIPMIIIR